jgi:hypothetical protein
MEPEGQWQDFSFRGESDKENGNWPWYWMIQPNLTATCLWISNKNLQR